MNCCCQVERDTCDSTIRFFLQAEDGIRDRNVTGVQTCALPISASSATAVARCSMVRSPKRDLSCQSRTGVSGFRPFSFASQSTAVCSLPISSTSLISSPWRSEEHTSELQSRFDFVCRFLLEKKKSCPTALSLALIVLTTPEAALVTLSVVFFALLPLWDEHCFCFSFLQ